MEIRSYEVDGVQVVEVRGALDAASAPLFMERLQELMEGHSKPVVVDLAGVDEVYSVGMGALLASGRPPNRTGRSFSARQRPFVREILRISLVDRQMPVMNDLREAIKTVMPTDT